jgi:hypothetical protein
MVAFYDLNRIEHVGGSAGVIWNKLDLVSFSEAPGFRVDSEDQVFLIDPYGLHTDHVQRLRKSAFVVREGFGTCVHDDSI